jgi:hypothetical protein
MNFPNRWRRSRLHAASWPPARAMHGIARQSKRECPAGTCAPDSTRRNRWVAGERRFGRTANKERGRRAVFAADPCCRARWNREISKKTRFFVRFGSRRRLESEKRAHPGQNLNPRLPPLSVMPIRRAGSDCDNGERWPVRVVLRLLEYLHWQLQLAHIDRVKRPIEPAIADPETDFAANERLVPANELDGRLFVAVADAAKEFHKRRGG